MIIIWCTLSICHVIHLYRYIHLFLFTYLYIYWASFISTRIFILVNILKSWKWKYTSSFCQFVDKILLNFHGVSSILFVIFDFLTSPLTLIWIIQSIPTTHMFCIYDLLEENVGWFYYHIIHFFQIHIL